jgi:hypothetical protein
MPVTNPPPPTLMGFHVYFAEMSAAGALDLATIAIRSVQINRRVPDVMRNRRFEFKVALANILVQLRRMN